jgi:hypothetical protein
LLDLAEIDADLNRIDHRRRTLPELAEIADQEKNLRSARDTVVSAETALGDLNREAKRQEDEIEAVRAREDRDRKLLKDGNVGARQVSDLEHELTSLQRRQGALEDDLLELMERREAVEMEVSHANEQLAKTERALADAQQRSGDVLTDLDTAQARKTAARAALVGRFPAELLKLYDRVRAQRGIGAALLRARRCGACRLELDRSAIVAIRDAAPDEVVRCEECGAILVRTPESGL